MKTLKTIALALAVLVAGVLLLALGKPDVFRVQRSATIQASPDKVFGLINDFRKWTRWSPWETLDPAMKRSFSGPELGKGSAYAWEGDKAGAGRMEILESVPASRILIDLQFQRPMEARNTAEYLLQEKDGATTVTWTMEGRNPFLGKLMQVFFDAENMVGRDFEKGLASMKAVAER